MDAISIGIISVLLAALGVLATLLAPRLTKSPKIQAGIESVDRFSVPNKAENLRVEVFNGDIRVEGPLFIVRGAIRNSGAMDITKDHFINPIYIEHPEWIDILSISSSTEPGVGLSSFRDKDRWNFSWSILKPKEEINFVSVVKAENSSANSKDIANEINIVSRLVNVKSEKILKDKYRIKSSIVMSLVTMMAMSVLAVGSSYFESRRIVFDYQGQKFALSKRRDDFVGCKIYPSWIGIQNCQSISMEEVKSVVPSATVSRVNIGLDMTLFILILLTGVLSGITFVLMRTVGYRLYGDRGDYFE